jgi:hypothetical protein
MTNLISPEEQYVQEFHAMALSLIMDVPLAAHRQFDSAPETICNLHKQNVTAYLALPSQNLEHILW